jgi:hypothetical protein
MPTVAVGMPLGLNIRAHPLAAIAMRACGTTPIVPRFAVHYSLPEAFNTLWAWALDEYEAGRVTHFAMIHADVCPDDGWLDVLLAELAATGADVVSAVIPLRGPRGLTSTAVEAADPWRNRRLTLAEVFALPETFTLPGILLNTGLWVCDLSRPWCGRVWFEERHAIRRRPDGTRETVMHSEDWEFSRAVRRLDAGARLYATRKVGVCHDRPEYHNRSAWGTCATDPDAT